LLFPQKNGNYSDKNIEKREEIIGKYDKDKHKKPYQLSLTQIEENKYGCNIILITENPNKEIKEKIK